MKKLLLTTTMSALISASIAVADQRNFNKTMYFKLEGGISQFNKINEKLVNKHSKFRIVPQIGLGFGGYIVDKFRADISLNHAFNPQSKYSTALSFGQAAITPLGKKYLSQGIEALEDLATDPSLDRAQPEIKAVIDKFANDPSSFTSVRSELINTLRKSLIAQGFTPAAADATIMTGVIPDLDERLNELKKGNIEQYNLATTDFSQAKINFKINRKSKVESAMINGYFDIIDVSNFKIFAGAGVGLAVLHEKIVASADLMLGDKVLATIDKTKNQKKTAKNFAYALKLGVSTSVADNIDLDLTGEFKDYGRTKSLKLAGVELGKVRYRSYGATAGIRVSF